MDFDSIAPHYDRFNCIASLGLCLYWKRRLLQTIQGKKELLDLCAGTGSIAFCFLEKNPKAKALLLDSSPKMLSIAQERGKKYKERFATLLSPAESVALPDHSFDAITCAYGIRNVENLDSCFSEAFRLLKEDGVFSIVELTRPTHSLIATFHRFYLQKAIPWIGKVVTSEKEPFYYLSETILAFPSPDLVEKRLIQAGFRSVQIMPLSCGIATLFLAKKR